MTHMKLGRIFPVFVVLALMALSLASCADVGHSNAEYDQLETRIGKLETQVKLLEAKRSVLEARINYKDKQIEKLTEDLRQHIRKIDAFTVLVTQHENDFHYLYSNLGWSGKESFGNWELHSSLWEAAWGCSGSCSGPTYSLRSYDK